MPDDLRARRFLVSGRVQAVGFRPFVYRLAHELGVRGWVRNVTGAVDIHAEASSAVLDAFERGLTDRAPSIARPRLEAVREVTAGNCVAFDILPSLAGEPDIHVPPDYFVCKDCLRELRDPRDRRHRYPFINCTQCGPRYTLIEALPYDRANTSMHGFPLCAACRAEYDDPLDRRHHAEPLACPACGPRLVFRSRETSAQGEAALAACLAALKSGAIVAVKGVGGYHLMCDATDEAAVRRLRARKPRPSKPLAVLFADLEQLRGLVVSTADTEAVLSAPARPIVLLPRRAPSPLCDAIAPGLAEIGCMLPYAPLHALLTEDMGRPLVATSGNVGGEPVITDQDEAEARLSHIADAFLHHDRPIVRPADDSVLRPIAGRARPLRLGRGLAPLELDLPSALREPVLALGAHTKNTLCLAWGTRAVISPHIGDLGSAKSLDMLAHVAADIQALYQVRAARLLLDGHPGYGYRAWARASGLPASAIGHHRAHASALAWEFPEVREWIVFTWDGVGLGEDGTLWGGEAFVGAAGRWRRAASLRPFHLPGGERAGREPWRSAAALLWETGHAAPFAPELLREAWSRRINSPPVSAAGRLFDAAAALTGVCMHASFEGEGPMRLEARAWSMAEGDPPSKDTLSARSGNGMGEAWPILPLARDDQGILRADWSPLLPMLQDTRLAGAERALGFHESMVRVLRDQARALRDIHGATDVGLTGGVFQNRLLVEQAARALEADAFRVHLPERVPVNDAGVSLGQVAEYLHTEPPR